MEAWEITTRECSARVLLIRILYSRWVHNMCLCWSAVYKILIQSNQCYLVHGLHKTHKEKITQAGKSWRARCTAEELQWRRMSGKLVRVPPDKKSPEMNGAASRRLGNYRIEMGMA